MKSHLSHLVFQKSEIRSMCIHALAEGGGERGGGGERETKKGEGGRKSVKTLSKIDANCTPMWPAEQRQFFCPHFCSVQQEQYHQEQ